MTKHQPYWFPAKRYGWGWGLPCTWQGWVVMLGFVVLLVAGEPLVLRQYGATAFALYVCTLVAALVAICWVRGEPPKWRWGE